MAPKTVDNVYHWLKIGVIVVGCGGALAVQADHVKTQGEKIEKLESQVLVLEKTLIRFEGKLDSQGAAIGRLEDRLGTTPAKE